MKLTDLAVKAGLPEDELRQTLRRLVSDNKRDKVRHTGRYEIRSTFFVEKPTKIKNPHRSKFFPSPRMCAECDVPLREKNPECPAHAQREEARKAANRVKRKRQLDKLPPCLWRGCTFKGRFEFDGKPICGHHLRRAKGHITRPYADYICDSCGCRYEIENPDCRTCMDRRYKRLSAEKKAR